MNKTNSELRFITLRNQAQLERIGLTEDEWEALGPDVLPDPIREQWEEHVVSSCPVLGITSADAMATLLASSGFRAVNTTGHGTWGNGPNSCPARAVGTILKARGYRNSERAA